MVREELVGDLKRRKAELRYAGLIEDLEIILFEAEEDFFAAARRSYRYDKKNTGFLDLSKQESILADQQVKSAIVSEIIQGGKTNTGSIEVEPGKKFFFVGITDSQPPAQLSFEEARQDVVTDMILERAYQKVQANSEAWLEEIRAGNTNLDDIATENKLTLEDPGYIERTETSIPRPIVEKVYEIPLSNKLPAYQTLQLGDDYNNEHTIIELLDIEEGAETSQTFVIYSLQNRESVAVLDSLKDFHEIRINLERQEEE